MMISYCIDGESTTYIKEEKEFNKKFTLLSKTEEAGMNYFFNNLPPELVTMPKAEKGKSKFKESGSSSPSFGWDPFDDFNFS